MISENSLDCLIATSILSWRKERLRFYNAQWGPITQYVYFLAIDIEISMPSQSKDTWSTTKISHFTKDTFIYQSLKRPALFHHDAMIHIVLHVSNCVLQIYVLEQSIFDPLFQLTLLRLCLCWPLNFGAPDTPSCVISCFSLPQRSHLLRPSLLGVYATSASWHHVIFLFVQPWRRPSMCWKRSLHPPTHYVGLHSI